MKIFFSYSHKDEALRDQLEAHLSLLRNQGLVESWHDRRITAGSEVDPSIAAALEDSEVILLLVSSDFIASNYCYSREMMRAMERHEAREANVVPVILRDCEWHQAPFGKLMAAPKDGKPVTLWPDIDRAFADVARQVRRVLEQRGGGKPAPAAPGTASSASSSLPVSPDSFPRSSNLRLKKDFTEHEKDTFLRDGFDYVARFFEGSLNAVAQRNPGVNGVFERVDTRCFSAVLYRQGTIAAECSVRLDGMGRRANGIAFAYDASTRSGSYNELLSVEASAQTMYFKPLGLQFGRGNREGQLSPDGAAEFLWDLLIARLQ